MTGILEAKPRRPGSIVTKGSSWYAMVHNLDVEPTCRLEWVVQAYDQVFYLVENKGISWIGIPPLGTVHGTLSLREGLEIFVKQVRGHSFKRLKKISVLAADGCEREMKTILAELCNGEG